MLSQAGPVGLLWSVGAWAHAEAAAKARQTRWWPWSFILETKLLPGSLFALFFFFETFKSITSTLSRTGERLWLLFKPQSKHLAVTTASLFGTAGRWRDDLLGSGGSLYRQDRGVICLLACRSAHGVWLDKARLRLVVEPEKAKFGANARNVE